MDVVDDCQHGLLLGGFREQAQSRHRDRKRVGCCCWTKGQRAREGDGLRLRDRADEFEDRFAEFRQA